jgi:hypothetical protein
MTKLAFGQKSQPGRRGLLPGSLAGWLLVLQLPSVAMPVRRKAYFRCSLSSVTLVRATKRIGEGQGDDHAHHAGRSR